MLAAPFFVRWDYGNGEFFDAEGLSTKNTQPGSV